MEDWAEERGRGEYSYFGMKVLATSSAPSLAQFAEDGDSERFSAAAIASICTMIYTEKGYLGLGPGRITPQPGDIVAVLFGARPCYLLRPFGQYFKLLGSCHIQGLMQGEAIEMLREGLLEETVFEIN